MATYTALFDANVLYSVPITDLVMELACAGIYRARWSPEIHDEWTRNVIKDRPDLPKDSILRRRDAMDIAVRDALVTDYEPLIGGLKLPDEGDRHVLAAAIAGRCDVIVTFNLKHFPDDAVSQWGIEVQHPDEFLSFQRTISEAQFMKAVKAVRARLVIKKLTPEEYIENLRGCGLQVVAAELEKVKALI